jgi:hypothetical protein
MLVTYGCWHYFAATMPRPQAPIAVTYEPARADLPLQWSEAIRNLVRLHSAPPGWRRAAGLILLVNAVFIALCITIGALVFQDTHELFRENKPGTLATVAVLVCSGIVCFKIRNRVRERPIADFWFAFGILMCLAGADDLLRLHEQADRLFHRLTGLNPLNKFTDHLDDAFVAAYTLPAAYFAFRHRKALAQVPLTVQLLAGAFVIFAIHLLFDVMGWNQAAEESLKQTAACMIWIALLATLFEPLLPVSWTSGDSAHRVSTNS